MACGKATGITKRVRCGSVTALRRQNSSPFRQKKRSQREEGKGEERHQTYKWVGERKRLCAESVTKILQKLFPRVNNNLINLGARLALVRYPPQLGWINRTRQFDWCYSRQLVLLPSFSL